MKYVKQPFSFFAILAIVALACNLPGGAIPTSQPEVLPTQPAPATATAEAPAEPPTDVPTAAPVVTHVSMPPTNVSDGSWIYDVESSGTAPEKRAPYGDSYDINRLERPFLQDMTYVSDLDIVTFSVTQDETWFYVSIRLIGNDPNNSLGINYGVELDTDHDGFGDYVIWAQPPYLNTWETANVKVYMDKNHNSAGLSSDQSDAPFQSDGYETLLFNGGVGDADPDMAWVRANASSYATLQFAFKKSWSGTVFMLGVVADAGLKDVGKLDYVDRFTEEQAGSPVKDKKYYPLKELYAVDNTCQEAFGFNPQGYETKLCPRTPPTPGPGNQSGCTNPDQYHDMGSCQAAGCAWVLRPGVFTVAAYYCTNP
ncbi:MAG: hypothetical protein KA480_05870 [Anaerolineales bacterium]|nr:hypothetical protein [Anaerolineales bacterium]